MARPRTRSRCLAAAEAEADRLIVQSRALRAEITAVEAELRQTLRAGATTSAVRQVLATLTAEGARVDRTIAIAAAAEEHDQVLRLDAAAKTLAQQSAADLLRRLAAFRLPTPPSGEAS